MSPIDEAVSRFAALPGTSVGRGPRHPSDPNSDVELRVSEFLEAYPTLRGDPAYVEFLEKYAGASIENEDMSQIVDVLGFTDASTDIEEMDGPIVDSKGFLMVAEAVYHVREDGRTTSTLQHAFAYDVTGQRPPGIYWSLVSSDQLEPSFTKAFDGFEAWLEEIVACEGWLEPPGRP